MGRTNKTGIGNVTQTFPKGQVTKEETFKTVQRGWTTHPTYAATSSLLPSFFSYPRSLTSLYSLLYIPVSSPCHWDTLPLKVRERKESRVVGQVLMTAGYGIISLGGGVHAPEQPKGYSALRRGGVHSSKQSSVHAHLPCKERPRTPSNTSAKMQSLSAPLFTPTQPASTTKITQRVAQPFPPSTPQDTQRSRRHEPEVKTSQRAASSANGRTTPQPSLGPTSEREIK